MDRRIENLLDDIFEIRTDRDYHFRKLYGLTFVFGEKIIHMNDRISSAEIKAIGIIYEENGQYYLAPIDGAIEIEEVVEKFVEKKLKK